MGKCVVCGMDTTEKYSYYTGQVANLSWNQYSALSGTSLSNQEVYSDISIQFNPWEGSVLQRFGTD